MTISRSPVKRCLPLAHRPHARTARPARIMRGRRSGSMRSLRRSAPNGLTHPRGLRPARLGGRRTTRPSVIGSSRWAAMSVPSNSSRTHARIRFRRFRTCRCEIPTASAIAAVSPQPSWALAIRTSRSGKSWGLPRESRPNHRSPKAWRAPMGRGVGLGHNDAGRRPGKGRRGPGLWRGPEVLFL